MRIGIIQCNTTLGAFDKSAELLLEEVRALAAQGAELCVAPAFALCGLGDSRRYGRERFLQASHEAAQKLALTLKQEGLPPLLIGSVATSPYPLGAPGSCAGKHQEQGVVLLLAKGQVETVVLREPLFPGCASDCTRPDQLTEGRAGVGEIHLQGQSRFFAVAFAEDLVVLGDDGDFRLVPHMLTRLSRNESQQALLLFGALPYIIGAPKSMEKALQALAGSLGVPVVLANLAGGTDGIVCYGGSFVVAPSGIFSTRLPMFLAASCVADLTAESEAPVEQTCREEEIWNALVTGIQDFVAKCGFSKVAIGLSGGIDSALVTALAVDALGPKNVTCLLMPSPYSSKGSIDDSHALAEELGISTNTISIAPMLLAYRRSFEEVFPNAFTGLTEENVQARIRGALMMAYANQFGAMVLTTGNKSELAVGYCTLYGDMCGGLAVLGDLYKTTVYDLCRWRNTKREGYIPEAIIEKEPSAELRPDQKDVDSLPPYSILDAILKRMIEIGDDSASIVDAGFAPADVHRVAGLLKRSEFKRHQAAPVIQISRQAFGKEWIMPIAGQ